MSDEKSRYYAKLFWLQAAARDIMGKARNAKRNMPRVCACCRVVVPGRNVQVWGRADIKKAKYRNVIRCADVWQCPVCANHITSHRRDDLQYVISTLDACIPIMVSFTISHSRRDSLEDSISVLSEAWRTMTQSKCFTRCKSAKLMKGYVRSLEVTWGDAHGWHPHYHALFFMRNSNDIAGFYKDIRVMWSEHVDKAGGSSSWEHACSLTVADTSISAYIAKWGHEPEEWNVPNLTKWGKAQEMTRSPMKEAKSGRFTPFEILAQYATDGVLGPGFWGKLFLEYSCAMKGKRQLTWSRTPDLRKAAGLAEEKAEQEIVEGEEAGYMLLAQLSVEEWGAVLWGGMRGVILDCCARGDTAMAMEIVHDCMNEHIKDIDISRKED